MVNFYSPPKKQLSTKKLTVVVHDLDAFGQGVARHNGKTIFIKSVLPDEKVDIQLIEDRKNYAKAKVIHYHNYSHERVKPQCRYFQVCGGCDMQHISSNLQHKAKYNALINLLQKETEQSLTHITNNKTQIIASKPYHYRRRARLAIHFIKNELMVGFRKAESNQIINIDECPVLVPELEAVLLPLQRCLQKIKHKKSLGHVELISVASGVIVCLRHTAALAESDIFLLKQFAESVKLSFYLHGEELIHLAGNTDHYYWIELPVGKLKLTFNPQDFIQVNDAINQNMISATLDWLSLQPTDNVLDLFCGMGNFSLPIATRCETVMGVEGVKTLVEKAQLNAKLNRSLLLATHSHFLISNLDDDSQFFKWSEAESDNLNRFNKVLLDPARAGAFNAIKQIITVTPLKIVYISCNPATLARDSKLLIEAGYHIERLAILDMFPQTKHIESMLLFTKSGT